MCSAEACGTAQLRRRQSSWTRSRRRWRKRPVQHIQIEVHIDGVRQLVQRIEGLAHGLLDPPGSYLRNRNHTNPRLASYLEIGARVRKRLDTHLHNLLARQSVRQ